MTLSEMFVDQEAQTFEQRRDEVVEIMSSALDLAGVDRGLATIMRRLAIASDETEFDVAFDEIVSGVRETTPAVLHST
jgi:hypothetical protein